MVDSDRLPAPPVEPSSEADLDPRGRSAVMARIGELLESSERENRPTAYEGLSNHARIALNAYQTEQQAYRDQAKAEMSQVLGVDYYA